MRLLLCVRRVLLLPLQVDHSLWRRRSGSAGAALFGREDAWTLVFGANAAGIFRRGLDDGEGVRSSSRSHRRHAVAGRSRAARPAANGACVTARSANSGAIFRARRY